ncbi:MAG: 16S rRNA (cytosine(1402)-N(4))-methyltransferase RsmH [Paracoccaceae bacterium]|nr:16S rRNA (cytosine(1402)-N(4))-methyltransferase RsmH [Paracoccaceae bacterium]
MIINQVDIQSHQPVLIKSLIEKLPLITGVWVDCTFGAGGYSKALLQAGARQVIGIDRDPNVSLQANALKARYGSKLELCEAKFSSLESILTQFGLKKISGVVFDIGVSSMQIDESDRGFSFQQDGPLDMRMSQKGFTASDIVNNASEEELANIIYYYGEDRSARIIARAIVRERTKQKILTTEHLSRVINSTVRRSNFKSKNNLNPSTLTFQALRIAVNDELMELNLGLLAAERVLDEGSMLAVVSFHSLEDRLVKQFIKSRSRQNSGQSRYLPDAEVSSPSFRELFKKVIKPSIEEISANPRARSAKLRLAVKIPSKNNQKKISKIEFPQVQFATGLQL